MTKSTSLQADTKNVSRILQQNVQAAKSNLSDLPSPDTIRWDIKCKAQVVNAVRNGHLSLDQACETYAMSVDEFLAWQSLFDQYGPKGLMATRVKELRDRRDLFVR